MQRALLLAAAVAIVALAAAAVLWSTRETPEAADGRRELEPASVSPADPPESTGETPRVRAPAVYVADKGRLSVTREALRDGPFLVLGLDLPDDARGEGPLPVKLVDARGRVLELAADPVDGAGSGLRLEIHPEWLRPGQYMIQVETAEAKPLSLRRYVLDVRAEADTANAE